MTQAAEQAQWYRGKGPIMEKFSRDRDGMVAGVAARVSTPPGYLIRGLTDLEIQAKYQLSDLNYKIAAEAIERELIQAGIDYDLAYKNAAISWELEKAGLYDVLRRELADAKKTREDRETFFANLAIEVGLRQVALINAKALLENEKEELRKQIAEAQGLTLDKEVELAQAKLVTAQRKLDIIPHLQALIDAEQDVLAAEQANVPLTEELINERLDQIPLKEEIAEIKGYLAAARDALTGPTLEVADKKQALAEARFAYEIRASDKVGPTATLVAAMEAVNAALQVYINKRGELVDPYLERATKLEDLIEPKTEYAQALAATVPYIQELAEKRRELIAPSIAKANALRQLIEPMIERAEADLEYAGVLKDIAGIDKNTKEIYLLIEELKQDEIDAELAVLSKRLESGDYEKALVEANVILKRLEAQHQLSLVNQSAVDSAEYLSLKQAGQAQVIEDEMDASTVGVDTKYEVARIKMETDFESTRTLVSAQAGNTGSIEKIAQIRARTTKEIARANAQARITSTLSHILA